MSGTKPQASGTVQASNADPSMEDILASIRRILSEEDLPPGAPAPAAADAEVAREPDVFALDASMLVTESAPVTDWVETEQLPPALAGSDELPLNDVPAETAEPAPPPPEAFAAPEPLHPPSEPAPPDALAAPEPVPPPPPPEPVKKAPPAAEDPVPPLAMPDEPMPPAVPVPPQSGLTDFPILVPVPVSAPPARGRGRASRDAAPIVTPPPEPDMPEAAAPDPPPPEPSPAQPLRLSLGCSLSPSP